MIAAVNAAAFCLPSLAVTPPNALFTILEVPGTEVRIASEQRSANSVCA